MNWNDDIVIYLYDSSMIDPDIGSDTGLFPDQDGVVTGPDYGLGDMSLMIHRETAEIYVREVEIPVDDIASEPGDVDSMAVSVMNKMILKTEDMDGEIKDGILTFEKVGLEFNNSTVRLKA